MTPIEAKPLPTGWKWAKLGDVCTVKTGIRDPGAKPDEAFQYVDISSIDNQMKRIVEARTLIGSDAPSRARQIIHAGDVIVSTTRPNLNAVAMVPDGLNDGICSTGFCVLRATDLINADYLFAFVQSTEFVQSLSDLVKGALYPAVTDRQVRAQSIPLPPLHEQRRIAAILTEQLAAVKRARAAAEAQLRAINQLPAAYLQVAFTGATSPAEVEKSKILLLEKYFQRSLPTGWKWVRLEAVCDKITDGTHLPPPFTNSGVPFLFVRNIVSGQINFNVEKYVSQEIYERLTARCRPERGDVLYSAVGSFGVAVVIDTDQSFTFQRHIAHIKPTPSLIDGRFLAYYLNSPEGRQQSEMAAFGGAQRTVTLKALSAFRIALPPLAEQKHIASYLGGQLDAAKCASIAANLQLDAINQLPATLLQQAFTGNV